MATKCTLALWPDRVKPCAMFGFGHIIRLSLAFLFALQLALPSVRISADGSFSAASYFCNPLTNSISEEAEFNLVAVLTLAGKDLQGENDSTEQGEHCQNCVITVPPIPAPSFVFDATLRAVLVSVLYQKRPIGTFYETRGPPLGMRAPPIFS